MHKIDGPGATSPAEEFTEGNPGLGIIATTVTDDWLNTVQRELVKVVEGAGLTLDKPTDTQVFDAILLLIGGVGAGAGISQAIVNNQAPLSITGLIFDKALVRAGEFAVQFERKTDTQDVIESGRAFVGYDPVADTWAISLSSFFGAAGVALSITGGGQVQYASNDLTGPSYSGTLRVIDIKKILETIP